MNHQKIQFVLLCVGVASCLGGAAAAYFINGRTVDAWLFLVVAVAYGAVALLIHRKKDM